MVLIENFFEIAKLGFLALPFSGLAGIQEEPHAIE
jgi:hypothetical protein